jgi:eukaryotic-like serine/threonine-protein kinase
MIGKTISHYRILEKLGEGGMGVVYKARDSHLDRVVALKILPAEKVADPDRKRRFVQEAKAASSLNHPHIVTIHDIDEADEVHFIAMEYVEGKTLDQLIPRHGMRLNEALKVAVPIADALVAAHEAGIVHRDLKPGNLIVTEKGQVKVLDFGLAKLTEKVLTGAEDATLTARENQIVGTVAYMSPEQAEGRKVDARSDIFSFGSVLYEMLTGQKPFQGDSKLSIMTAILREDPKPATQIVKSLPQEVERIISRCLRKDQNRRFQHMGDVKVELEELKEESDSGKLLAAPGLERARQSTLTLPCALIIVSPRSPITWRSSNAVWPCFAMASMPPPPPSWPGCQSL